MRSTIALITVMLALLMAMPAMGKGNFTNPEVNYLSPQSTVDMTSSMAAFLNDSWVPAKFEAPVNYAAAANKDGVLANASPEIYKIVDSAFNPLGYQVPIDQAAAMDKEGKIATRGWAIYEFLDDTWTPDKPLPAIEMAPYKKHQMS